MNFIIVGYYTRNTIYQEKAEEFRDSMLHHNIPFYIEGIDNLGDWWKNTNYKPTFLREMLDRFYPKSIVYVDCDAKFFGFPTLFEDLYSNPVVNVGVHLFDRSCYKRSQHGFEVLSGTIFLKNNSIVRGLVDEWVEECRNNPRKWDQKSLEKVLNGDFYRLPGEYCKIFDKMEDITKPIIVHYQASRQVRREGLLVRKR